MTTTSSATSPSLVTAIAPAPPAEAVAHFEALLRFETDCWDVHASLDAGATDFVLLDVRSRAAWDAGHVAGAIHLPHREIDETTLADFGAGTVFVVYCNGPHCNGADRAARRLAELGRPVKKMIGGIEGWRDESFSVVS